MIEIFNIKDIMAGKKVSADEAKWRAEQDARTLADSQAIFKDRKRYAAAQKAAQRMASEYNTKAQNYQYAAGGKVKKK